MTEADARRALLRYISLPEDELVIGLFAEKAYGWIYFYDSRAHVVGGDISAAILGDGPVVVPNDGGAPFGLGSRLAPEVAIAEFERQRGLLPSLVVVRFFGWQDSRDQRRATLVRTMVSVLGWGVARAKAVIDELAENGFASVECPDEMAAKDLAVQATDLGVIVYLDEAGP